MRKLIICCLALLLVIPAAFAQDDTAIWQSADDIRTSLFDAQRALFSASRATNPTAVYQDTAELIDDALATYSASLQPVIEANAPQIDSQITTLLDSAHSATLTGDATALAVVRGRLWTALLNAGYEVTLNALDSGDLDTAENWLRLREYRQATKATLVLSPAAQALADLRAGDIDVTEATSIISGDLRDTYFFRMRQALNEVDDAIARDFTTRAAEWSGQAQGYFAILEADYRAKLGDSANAVVQQLDALTASATDGNAQASILAEISSQIANYQPVELSEAELAERSQLLYIFTDLVYIEYKDGVRNGEITTPIEYQEAMTFRDQAEATFVELRPIIVEDDPDAAAQLETLLADIQAAMERYEDPSQVQAMVIQTKDLIKATLPLDQTNSTSAAFTVVSTLLDDMENAVADNRYTDAEQSRLQAYALFDFGPEQRLMAFSPELAQQIDALFWYGTGDGNGLSSALATQADADTIAGIRTKLDNTLDEAQIVLGSGASPLTVIINAAIIVFREGLEAVVIIAALSAGMVNQNRRLRRPLFLGAAGAFLVTGLTWIVADAFLSLFRDYGERLEAVVSIIALGVLLLITNWFFHNTYWTDHLAGFHQKKSKLLRGQAGQYLGLIILGFTSIYREGFETVLFQQALVLDAGLGVVLQGTLLGLIAVLIVGYITFALQTRLPYMHMMVATGVLIGGVLLILVGNTVRVMQVVGWIPVHPIAGVNFPFWWGQWFGVYPTWEGIFAQIGAAVFVIGSYYLAKYQKGQQRRHSHSQHPQESHSQPKATPVTTPQVSTRHHR
ncbi:MAG: FTR1 family protein [Anaerolineae bacterium]|nr:FTR1 family protein [Anaerolineae bacterium]